MRGRFEHKSNAHDVEVTHTAEQLGLMEGYAMGGLCQVETARVTG